MPTATTPPSAPAASAFVRPPADQRYGTVAVFEDLYGNLWDLVQPAAGD